MTYDSAFNKYIYSTYDNPNRIQLKSDYDSAKATYDSTYNDYQSCLKRASQQEADANLLFDN